MWLKQVTLEMPAVTYHWLSNLRAKHVSRGRSARLTEAARPESGCAATTLPGDTSPPNIQKQMLLCHVYRRITVIGVTAVCAGC